MKTVFLFAVFLLIAGCITFHPQPISPNQTASQFEARTINNPGFKEFLEANLRHEMTPWPPKSWDFTMLTLAAFYYHPDLDIARAQWGVATAGMIAAGGRPNPSVGFTPEYNADATSGLSPWILGFTFDIPIETAGKRDYRITRAQQLSEAARLNIATVAWQVRSRLRANLLDFYAANQAESILKRQQAVREEIVQVLEQRLTSGEVSLPDVTQAHISLEQVRLSLQEAQKQSAEARVRIADALGLPVGALDGIEISFDSLEELPLVTNRPSQDVRHQALVNRPDILGALAEYAAGQSALQLEIAKQYPDLHLGPGYTWDQEEDKWSLGFSLTLPVLNRNEGPIAEAEARRTEAQARFTALQARVIGEIDSALTSTTAALQKLETADSLLSAQKDQLQSMQAMFDLGETDRLTLLSAQFELESAALSRLDALVKVQQSLGLLEDGIQRPLDPAKFFPAVPEINHRTKEETDQ